MATTVLHGVDLELRSGEVHGVVGENGSGKSTLIKIMAGVHEPDGGASIELRGAEVGLPLDPATSRSLGLSFVHQDLALEASLSVAENFTVDRLSSADGWRLDLRREQRQVRETLLSYGLDVDPRVAVARLNQVERAMLAIVRAVERMRAREPDEPGVLVLDEPTVFLPLRDRGKLFDLMRRLTGQGNAVLFVSHDLEECLTVCDRISVLRDGHLQATVEAGTVSRGQIVEMMIGHALDVGEHRPASVVEREAPVVAVDGLCGGVVRDISFEVHPGEILGVTGLLGSGFDEVPYLLAGARHNVTGSITIGTRTFRGSRYRTIDAVESGVALVPGDRARDGSVRSMSVQDNISVQSLDQYRTRFGLNWRAIRRDSEQLLVDYDVRPPALWARYGTLSGGNQQKVMLAKWLQTKPTLLLLHEPTQGVDVGAREQIYAIVRSGAAEGAAVVCASADHEQLAILCDRVLVVRDGRIAAEIAGADLTKATIARECLRADATVMEG